MALDRIKLLMISGICLLISIFSMNEWLLAVSVVFFITVALYNIMVMLQNNMETLKKNKRWKAYPFMGGAYNRMYGNFIGRVRSISVVKIKRNLESG